ncbi:MAG: hypothetical protein ACK52I_28135 [Pseudomonadota bacterium]
MRTAAGRRARAAPRLANRQRRECGSARFRDPVQGGANRPRVSVIPVAALHSGAADDPAHRIQTLAGNGGRTSCRSSSTPNSPTCVRRS